MKRRALQAIVFLLLGAILNVAAAWGVASTQTLNRKGQEVVQLPAMSHKPLIERAAGSLMPQCDNPFIVKYRAPGLEWLQTTLYEAKFNDKIERRPMHTTLPNPLGHANILWAGWPTRALTACTWQGRVPSDSRTNGFMTLYKGYRSFAGLNQPLQIVSSVPIVPIWPGFAINTIFYATVLWVMFFAPGTVRRAIRRKRGQCENCAYPIGSSPVCTECGAAVTPRPSPPHSVQTSLPRHPPSHS